jgi:hypothetical protein
LECPSVNWMIMIRSEIKIKGNKRAWQVG